MHDTARPVWFANELDHAWTTATDGGRAIDFHRTLAEYAATPLIEFPSLAVELGVGHVLAKVEIGRLGLPAFKALGASWAIHRVLQEQGGASPLCLVTATDGNHGRAVAHFARLAGQRAQVVVPRGVHPAAIQAIRDEGAQVTVLTGTYEDAVAHAVQVAQTEPSGVLVQDMGWPGYEQIPSWIVEGYSTMFAEISAQLTALGLSGPDLVIVPTGVGSLLQAAVEAYRQPGVEHRTAVVSVEPDSAACVLAGLAAGEMTTIETGDTVMSGLNCGTASALAWPAIANGVDAAVAVSDSEDSRAAEDLASLGVAAGPCGAAGLAGLRSALLGAGAAERRAHLGIGSNSVLVMLVTEGADANPSLRDRQTG